MPWKFAPGLIATIPEGSTPAAVERALASWALTAATDWTWIDPPSAIDWRPEQRILLDQVAELRRDAIGMLEGGTGIGKTRAFAWLASAADQRVVIAVPTLSIGSQWIEAWKLFCDAPLAQAWGRSHYSDNEALAIELQDQALQAAGAARAVLCTHQMIPKVLEAASSPSMLLVDEAHLLSASMAGLAGKFVPAAVLGPWITRWCNQQTLPGADDEEIELGGRMRELVVRRLVPQPEQHQTWRASVVTRQGGEPLLWVRHAGSVDTVLQQLWARVSQAVLFSGTLSWQTYAGVRTLQHQARRLAIPAARLQDLGRVRAEWRDEGVTVLRPAREQGVDGKAWLGAYRGREEIWWPEAADAILDFKGRGGKTLVLANSYADIAGIAEAMGKTTGVVVAEKGMPMDEQAKKFARKTAWCWLATGAAWTGMDTNVPLQRVVITKLPLPDPQAMRLLAHPQDAVYDAVARLRQGVGRLVRAAGGTGLEIVIMDGRINDLRPRWRTICQPFMQVLGEEFETHGIFVRSPNNG
ncbi:helicase C-terminal domain-containing protein [Paracidovorax wautersii]|nr:helicase C-terminal domain-containing protein [Paracidovorax wautersii]